MATKFNKATAEVFRNELNLCLSALATKHGVAIRAGGCVYSDDIMTFKVEVAQISVDGTVATKAARMFKELAPYIGMKPDDLGREFSIKGATYRLIGYNSRRPKFPFIAERSDKKQFCLPETAVKKALGYNLSVEEILAVKS